MFEPFMVGFITILFSDVLERLGDMWNARIRSVPDGRHIDNGVYTAFERAKLLIRSDAVYLRFVLIVLEERFQKMVPGILQQLVSFFNVLYFVQHHSCILHDISTELERRQRSRIADRSMKLEDSLDGTPPTRSYIAMEAGHSYRPDSVKREASFFPSLLSISFPMRSRERR